MDTKLKTAIFTNLRRIHRNYDQISKKALKDAQVAPATHKCAYCGVWTYSGKKSPQKLNMELPEGVELKFSKTKIDHIRPIIGVEGFQDWELYVTSMFCEIDNYAVCCKACHDSKSKVETGLRAKYRKAIKEEKDTSELNGLWEDHVKKYKR